MVKGRLEGYRELLGLLGRAAGLSSLALATLASGPCGTCTEADECASVQDLVATRDAGVAANGSASSAGTTSQLATNLATAMTWDGMSCPNTAQYAAIVELKFPDRYTSSSVRVNDLSNGKCCYHVEEHDCGEGGRPFLVQGQARVATLRCDDATASEAPDSTWLADAQVEHASVAAFARLSLQLLALGAPPELIQGAQLASLDELRHADFFFGLASREAGCNLRPGPLDVSGALHDLRLAGLVESNLLEGCIGETLAAEQLRARARRSDDAQLSAALLQIADDETRHAELAFRILAWCREVAPDVTRRCVQRILRDEEPRRSEHEAWQHVVSPLLGALC